MDKSGQRESAKTSTTVMRKSDCELAVMRTFDSPAHKVFDAWTRPELFRLWWAPKSMGAALSACEIDARTGGGYRITFDQEGSDSMTFFGKYLEVSPPARLVWTNEESDDAPVTTVIFEDQGDKTLVTLSELYSSSAPVAEAAAGMQAMMSEQFDQLDELLAHPPTPA